VRCAHNCKLVLLAVVLFAISALGESIEKWKTPARTLFFGNRPPAGSTLLGTEETEESPGASRAVGAAPARNIRSASLSEHIGRVVGIADGDTFTFLVDRQRLRIRLAEIDTPEKGQPYGNRARQALSDMIFERAVRVVEIDHDRYGRVVGRVYVGSLANALYRIRSAIGRRCDYVSPNERRGPTDARDHPIAARAEGVASRARIETEVNRR
jgi:nuclease-like protein